jgi:AcrR family transcriptional regulator
MTTSPAPLEHPLLTAVRLIGEALDETALVDPMFMSPAQKRELLVGLTRVLDRLQARRTGVLAVAGDVAAEQGARSPGVWLAAETHTSPREAAAVERVGAALGRRWTQTAEAGHFGPSELARLGRRVLEVVAPDVADAEEARALAEEQGRARRVGQCTTIDWNILVFNVVPLYHVRMAQKSTREYHSPLRREQAEQTRAAILAAAGDLFTELGWDGTSMGKIATRAGVSMETVYSGFGSKSKLLTAVMDVAVVGDDEPFPLAERESVLGLTSGSRSERVIKAARMAATISERTCDLVRALIQGASANAALAQKLADLDARRRGEIARFFELVTSRPPTGSELDEVWLLTSAEVFHMFVRRSGWTPQQYERWLADRLEEITSASGEAGDRDKNLPLENRRRKLS